MACTVACAAVASRPVGGGVVEAGVSRELREVREVSRRAARSGRGLRRPERSASVGVEVLIRVQDAAQRRSNGACVDLGREWSASGG